MKMRTLMVAVMLLTTISARAQWRVGATTGGNHNFYSMDKQYMSDFNKSNEKLGATVSSGSSGGSDMKYEKVPAYAQKYQDTPIMKFLFNFTADGKATYGSWE